MKGVGSAPEFKPLILPQEWTKLPLYPDAVPGIGRLRRKFTVLTLSNFPLWLQLKMCKNAGITFDGMMVMELMKMYKPFSGVYRAAAKLAQVSPENCLMVTSNKSFGDLEGAEKEGMQSVLVDRHNQDAISSEWMPRTFVELAAALESQHSA